MVQETKAAGAPETLWHMLPPEEITKRQQVETAAGLTTADAQKRLQKFGLNELVEGGIKSPWAILWEQLTAPLVLILIFAAVVSGLLGKYDSLIAILAIVILNAILGLTQEYRAERAIAALKQMAAPLVRVRRDGQVSEIAGRDLVPGDVVLVEAGNIIPADMRLMEAANLQVMEASLTGESVPVEKNIKTLDKENMPLGDRRNIAYLGTSVTNGRGTAVVVETGMRTELGKIATLIQSVTDEKTPLQKRMAEVGTVLLGVAFVVMGIAFVIGFIVGETFEEILVNAVAIAVAVVPEGLPAVVTISLALGAQRMLKRRALIRKLPAVETLGSVTVICSDKTGTLTENRMTVRVVDVADHTVDMTVIPKGKMHTTEAPALLPYMAQKLMMATGTLCNDAVLQDIDSENVGIIGDPTEGALVLAAVNFGLRKPDLDVLLPRIGEVPFSSERKRMTTVHSLAQLETAGGRYEFLNTLLGEENASTAAFCKGAVDTMLPICDHIWSEGQIMPMTPEWRTRIEERNNKMASEGLRVLGTAFRLVKDGLPTDGKWEPMENHMVFVGMVGIIDPPRAEVRGAVDKCKHAGIRPVMITGDHPLTAKSIAKELHIIDEDGQVKTGTELSEMSDEQLQSIVNDVSVYARVSPEHKLRIVRALQKTGQIAAMTGDGVNDAPALKQADIGVAMGITGTDVSKEAADMVILDDNFATIVSAVEEGRTIYDNVRRFIKYLLASNTGELLVLLLSQLVITATLPLTTLQILWMNLITDGVPALALGTEKTERGAMSRAPYPPNESIFGHGMARHILLVGFLLGMTGLLMGYWAWETELEASNGELAWNTMIFLVLTLSQMGHALAVRSHRESTFTLGFLTNPLLVGAVVFTVIVQLGAIYLPFFNDLFNTNPLTLEQLVLCFVLSTVVFWGVEVEKLLIRRGILK